MTPEETKALIEEIVAQAGKAADIASIFAPQFKSEVIIGKAVASLFPALAENVQKWAQGVPPTPEEKQVLAEQLAVLSDPNLP